MMLFFVTVEELCVFFSGNNQPSPTQQYKNKKSSKKGASLKPNLNYSPVSFLYFSINSSSFST